VSGILRSWCTLSRELSKFGGAIHLNLGQSWVALVREGMALAISSVIVPKTPAIISLHGSWFMSWGASDPRSWWLRFLVQRSRRITVLGENQRQKLVSLDIPYSKVAIINNTCEPEFETMAVDAERHFNTECVNILFLSHLVDTKGFPEYLEALQIV